MGWGVPTIGVGASNGAYPSLVTIPVLSEGGVDHSGFPSILFDSGCIHAGRRGAGADGSWLEADVVMAAGTWRIDILHLTQPASGIVDVLLDGTEVGSIDFYSASTTRNVASSVTGVAVATGGLHTVRLLVDGQNASSSGFAVNVQALTLRKTA